MTETAQANHLVADNHQESNQQRYTRQQRALQSIFGNTFVKTFSSPFLVLEGQRLESPVSIRFFKKDFAYLSKQLYLEYQYRSWKGFNADLLERYAEIITTKLGAMRTLMTNNINRIRKLLEQQGQKAELTLWPTHHRCDVPIIATQARTYFDLLLQLDQVYSLSGNANLMGVIDSAQRAKVEYESKRAVRAFRSILQTEVSKLYREAERVIQVQANAGVVDDTKAALVAEQGKDIAEFNKSSEADDQADEDMNLNGADPGAVIDAAAAASTAAATTGARKRTKKTEAADPSAASSPSPAPAPAPAEASTTG